MRLNVPAFAARSVAAVPWPHGSVAPALSTASPSALWSEVAAMRRRSLWTSAAIGATATLLVAAAAAVAVWPKSVTLGVVAAGVTVALGGVVTALVWRRRAQRPLARWAARLLLQTRRPNDAEQLRSALELPETLGALAVAVHREASVTLPWLQRALRQRASRALALAALAGAGLGLELVWALPRLAAARAGQRPGTMAGPEEVATLLQDVRMRARPPAYAEPVVPATDEASESIEVLRGSRVEVQARLGSAVHAVEVELRRGAATQRVVPDVAEDGSLRFALDATEPSHWRVVGKRSGGRAVREREEREIAVRPDQHPSVELTAPVGEVEVRPGATLVIEGQALDDIGIAQVEVVLALPTGGERRKIALTPGDRRVGIRESVDIDRLGLRAGELATLWLEVRDIATIEGPQQARSEAVVVRMFSAERHHARILEELARLAAAYTLALADRLEGDPLGPGRTLALALADQATQTTQEAALRTQLGELRQALTDDVLGRAQTSADLSAIERDLRLRADEEARAVAAVDRASPHERRERARLARWHLRVVEGLEDAVLTLAHLAAAEHRNALLRDGKGLADLQSALRKVLEQLAKDPDNASLRAEAERLLDAIARQMERMAAEAGRQTRLVPPEQVNASALEPDALQKALQARTDALHAVRQALRRGDMQAAMRSFEQARAELDGAMEALSAEAEAERTAEDEAREHLLRELRQGIDRSRAGEQAVQDEVDPLAEEQDRMTAAQRERQLREAMGRLQALLDDARDQIRPRRLQSAALRSHQATADARAALTTAANALARGDVDAALLALVEAEERLVAADASAVGPVEGDQERRRRDADRLRIAAAADRAARAAALLREAMPRPEALHTPQTRRRLQALGQQQEQVRRGLERLRARLQREAQRHPGLAGQVGGRLDHADQMMRQASEAAQQSDAGRAARRMAEAQQALEAASQMVQRGQGGAGSSGAAPGGAEIGHGASQAPLPLPPAQRAGAEDYRRQLQDAASRPAPPGWEERLRRYWQRLRE